MSVDRRDFLKDTVTALGALGVYSVLPSTEQEPRIRDQRPTSSDYAPTPTRRDLDDYATKVDLLYSWGTKEQARDAQYAQATAWNSILTDTLLGASGDLDVERFISISQSCISGIRSLAAGGYTQGEKDTLNRHTGNVRRRMGYATALQRQGKERMFELIRADSQ